MSNQNHLTAEKDYLQTFVSDKFRSTSFNDISSLNSSSPHLIKRLSSPLSEHKTNKKKLLERKLSKSSLDLSSRNHVNHAEKESVSANDFRQYLNVETSPRTRLRNPKEEGEISPRLVRNYNLFFNTPHRRSLDVPLFRCDSYDDTSSAYEDETDAPQLAHEQIEKLWKKIENVKEELMKLQAIKDENVTFYLKTTDNQIESGGNSKLKLIFERNNQKTNVTIQSLQKKLEKYQHQMKAIEDHGLHGGKKIIKVVQDHVRSRASSIQGHMVEQLESFNNFLKKDKKSLSMDNITASSDILSESDLLTDEHKTTTELQDLFSSDDETMASLITRTGRKKSTGKGKKDSIGYTRDEEIQIMRARVEILEEECELQKQNVEQFGDMMKHLLQSLQDEKYKSEQLHLRLSELYTQWNDLTELHQNEMSSLMDELDRTLQRIECVEYRSTERSAELEESVENLSTNCLKLERHQQDQLLQPLDEYRDINAKIFLSKCFCFLINISLLIVFVISSITKAVTPLVSTPTRSLALLMVILSIIYLWKYLDYEAGLYLSIFSITNFY